MSKDTPRVSTADYVEICLREYYFDSAVSVERCGGGLLHATSTEDLSTIQETIDTLLAEEFDTKIDVTVQSTFVEISVL